MSLKCKYCGLTGFKWQKNDEGKYQLFDPVTGKLHKPDCLGSNRKDHSIVDVTKLSDTQLGDLLSCCVKEIVMRLEEFDYAGTRKK